MHLERKKLLKFFWKI